MIHLKTESEIAKMRAAGLVVAAALDAVRAAIAPGVTTADLDAVAEETIRAAGATSNFKGYCAGGTTPYPATICASVNDEVVHGIPSKRRVLREGDVISVDCGAVLDGWHGDSAFTAGVGEVDPSIAAMLEVCEESMWRGIAAGVVGGRLSDIGHAVESYVRSQGPYGIVEEYGGHGIGTAMHQEPHVPNHGRPGKGLRLQAGLTLAVEPMIMMGQRRVATLDDDWTVVTVDRSWAAHFEHTFALTPAGPQVLTAPDFGVGRLGGGGLRGSESAIAQG
jgi:methionyl aminopeptidase